MAIDERLLKSVIAEVLKEMSKVSADAVEGSGDEIVLTEDEDALIQICRQYMMRGQCPRYMNQQNILCYLYQY